MSTDEKCYISHSGDAVYWLGQKHDETHDNKIVSCLVVYNNLTKFDFETQKEKRQAAEKDNAYQVYDLRALKTERNENNKEEWPRMTMPRPMKMIGTYGVWITLMHKYSNMVPNL